MDGSVKSGAAIASECPCEVVVQEDPGKEKKPNPGKGKKKGHDQKGSKKKAKGKKKLGPK